MPYTRSSLPGRRDALIALNAIPGISTRFPMRLFEKGLDPSCLFGMTPSELSAQAGLNEKTAINLVSFDVETFVRAESQKAETLGVKIMTMVDEDYPPLLRQIADPPAVLYIRGRLPQPDEVLIAIVGAREATLYGLGVAERLGRRFAEMGVGVVSGMARGIDAAAHQGALNRNGYTLAVLGCGIDIVYPSSNKKIYDAIGQKGCLVSEFPLGTRGFDYNFPRRNRIVSGLCQGTIVVEARVKSGALITAQFALEQGRDVFAVPGPVDSIVSRGPHELIRNGARLILCAEDVFEEVRVVEKPPLSREADLFEGAGLAPDEEKVLAIIREGETSLETLMTRTGLSSSTLMGPCLSLQLRRLVRELPGKRYEIY